MRRNKGTLITILIILLVLFATSLIVRNTAISGGYTMIRDMIGSIIAIIGVTAIWYQLKREKDLSEAEFIINLNNTFTTNSDIKYIYKKIEESKNQQEDPFTDEDMIRVVDYLTFFEIMSNLIQRKVLNLDMINDLFAYRFFAAVHNPHIQKREIIKDAAYYKNLYILHSEWTKYRKKNKLYIPHDEFSLEKMDTKYNCNTRSNINEYVSSVS
jgi:hypothetical protein